MSESGEKLTLGVRAGLPDELRVLLGDHPRAAWTGHPDFHGLVAFWLDRHGEFRDLTGRLQADARALLGNGMDAATFKGRLARQGSTLVQHLIGHHQIEDAHYFPELERREPGLSRGFEILDRDHHELDGLLHGFAEVANTALLQEDDSALREAVAPYLDRTARFAALLERHLTDEEDLIFPVIFRHGVR